MCLVMQIWNGSAALELHPARRLGAELHHDGRRCDVGSRPGGEGEPHRQQ